MPFTTLAVSFDSKELKLLTNEFVHSASQFLSKACPSASKVPFKLKVNLLERLNKLQGHLVLNLDARFWSAVVSLHGWALRALAAEAKGDVWTADVLLICGTFLSYVGVAVSGCEVAKRVWMAVATALLDGDAFQASARLLAFQYRKRQEMVAKQPNISGPLNACLACARTVRYNLVSSEGHASRRMFLRLVEALSESQLLEHAARLLVTLQSVLHPSDVDSATGSFLELLRLAASDLPVEWTVQGPRCLNAAGEAAITHPDMHATLAKLRGMLSRPCLQFFLGYLLITRRHWLYEEGDPNFGLPAELLDAGVANESKNWTRLPDALATAADVWRLTVSGPLPPRIAQPPNGLLTEAAAGAQQPVPMRPSGMPYAAVNVFDMAHAALKSLWVRACKTGLKPGSLADDDRQPLASSCLLLARLCLELRPQHAVARLPQLWRNISGALGLIDFWELDRRGRCELPLMLGLLLRMELEAPEQSGEQSEDEEELPAAARGCPYSLGCAIDSPFLYRLEGLLRRAAAAVVAPSSSTTKRATGFKVCLCLVNSVLRYSGMWPAAMAHGSRRTVASLIVALRRVTRAMLDWEDTSPEWLIPAAGQVSNLMGIGSLDAKFVMVTYLSALLEQLIAVMQLPQPPPQQQPGSAVAAGAGARQGGRGKGGNRGGGSSSSKAHAQLVPLYSNDAIEDEDSAPMQVEWLVRAGGCPAAGSRAAAQQRSLTALALTQWLPLAVGRLVYVGVARAVRFTALQCLAAYVRSGASPAAGAESRGSAYEGGSGSGAASSGAGGDSGGTDGCGGHGAAGVAATSQAGTSSSAGTSAATDPDHSNAAAAAAAAKRDAEAWQDFLMHKTNVAPWICCVLSGACRDWHPPLRMEPESAALDALEVLLLAAPEPADVAGSVSELRQHMPAAADRHGRPALLAVLRHLWRQASKERGAAGGGKLPGLMKALWQEVRAQHDLTRLPVLPSPVEVQRSAEAWGVVLCDNPECGNVENVTKAKCKTCSRCVQVRYCCGACQLAHWRAAHSNECAEMAAAAGAHVTAAAPASGGR